MNVPVETCLIVGDTEADIIAARRAGGTPVAMLTGEDHLDLFESEKPEFIFKNLTEFTLFLEEQERIGEIWSEEVEGIKEIIK
jgi:phosphoglycolate phosphatase-like HAD superfamily hydrolase